MNVMARGMEVLLSEPLLVLQAAGVAALITDAVTGSVLLALAPIVLGLLFVGDRYRRPRGSDVASTLRESALACRTLGIAFLTHGTASACLRSLDEGGGAHLASLLRDLEPVRPLLAETRSGRPQVAARYAFALARWYSAQENRVRFVRRSFQTSTQLGYLVVLFGTLGLLAHRLRGTLVFGGHGRELLLLAAGLVGVNLISQLRIAAGMYRTPMVNRDLAELAGCMFLGLIGGDLPKQRHELVSLTASIRKDLGRRRLSGPTRRSLESLKSATALALDAVAREIEHPGEPARFADLADGFVDQSVALLDERDERGPIMMMFPAVVLLFPALFIALLGPVIFGSIPSLELYRRTEAATEANMRARVRETAPAPTDHRSRRDRSDPGVKGPPSRR